MDVLSKQLQLLRIFQINNLRRLGSFDHNKLLSDPAKFSDYPVITTPQKMVQKLEKLKERKQREKRTSKPRAKGPLVISCQRKNYNFHRNEKFMKDDDFFKLVSCGWKNRKRNGDHFTLTPYADNPSVQQANNILMFDELGLNDQLCERLHDMGFETPTKIQQLAIPPFLRGQNVICAAETGSGKTLSYLAPAIERISYQKNTLRSRQYVKDSPVSNNDDSVGNPHTLVITPNRELTEQVMNVAQALTSSTEIIPHCVVGGTTKKSDLGRSVNCPMDILITTPGILNKMLHAKCLRKSNLQSIVIDESDTLLDDSFLDSIHDIFHRLQVSLSAGGPVESNNPFLDGIQLALVSATMPRDLDNAIGHIIPVEAMTKITTDSLHHLMPHVPQTFHRINPDSKPEKLIQLLKKNLGQVCLIFTKNSQTCFYLKKLLRDNGIEGLLMNGELTAKEREGIFSQFKEGYCDVLVATDIASRGLDTTNVHHVINYDFPVYLSDYVHRVGRVGRVGAKHTGRVTSFVSHKWDVELLWKIETSARTGAQLENINANIKRKLQSSHPDADLFTVNAIV